LAGYNFYIMEIIGRDNEKKILIDALSSTQSEMIAVYGRRRVGKTFLIENVFEDKICFSISGIHKGSLKDQLNEFSKTLFPKKKDQQVIANWFDAFDLLETHVEAIKGKQKKVIFIDELPWLDTPKSKFIAAFEHFWNTWASKRTDIILVICGSAASWMIKKILNSKGGLHNRVTIRIRLLPFNLNETEQYLKTKNIRLNRYDLCQLYMSIGGIPFYLKQIRRGESVTQNIERICFAKDGLLHTEFDNLYRALFNNAAKHIAIINSLAVSPQGLNRNTIIKNSKFESGGGVSEVLNELLESGFITEIPAQNTKAKNNIYRLTDEYSLFYLKFIQQNKFAGAGAWASLSKTQSYTTWCGYAFENICFKHTNAIKKALGIAAVYTNIYSWHNNKAQIDILLDREDRCINICEIKYYKSQFEITKSYETKLRAKMEAYQHDTNTNKNLFLTFITSRGLKENMYKTSLVENSLTLDDLFYADE
jgi:uncharacterized protein